jgi:hypothetical protein
MLLAPAAIAPLAVFGGCGGDDPIPRFGQQGDSCLTTNDCAVPLPCVANVCGGTPTEMDGGNMNMDANVMGDGPSADAGPWSACDGCLDMKCAEELANCDEGCIGIEACLEVVCTNLSAIGSAEEGMCQKNCQNQFPGASALHKAVVDCSIIATCRPPCTTYPDDFDACRAFMDKGDCFGALAACQANNDCVAYRSCVGSCTTLAECSACSATPEGAAGRQLLQAYEVCIASECISESWLLNE